MPFERPTLLESLYRSQIQKLIDRYFEIPDFATLGEINARLVEYGQATSFFETLAARLAKRMVTQVAVKNADNWRAAARIGSKGNLIHTLLRRTISENFSDQLNLLIRENSQLIVTLPHKIALQASKHAYQQFTNGVRSDTIVKQMRPYMTHLKTWEIKRIARTEVAKADTAITRVRADDLGLNWYVWRTSKDARVRESHKLMNGVLVNWHDTPAPEVLAGETSQGRYDAGNIWNCRCVALPLVRLNQIAFPTRVYYHGRIQMFSLKQFAMLSGMQLGIAA